MEDGKAPRIVAMVLTHNAPQALARCLVAINSQTTPPDEIMVVDNASEPPVTVETLPPLGPPVRVIRSDSNLGPAGGWAIALRDFLSGTDSHAWLMDDDIVPEPACLASLWEAASDQPASAFVIPVSIQVDGTPGRWGSWCGFLIAHQVVEAVGVPREELFWWAEDTEYCHWRLPRAGYFLRFVDKAVVHHDAIRQDGDSPTWKYYYEARNMLYLHWHIMHRLGRYPKNMARLVGRAMFKQRAHRLKALAAIGQGVVDGAFGRLGIRYPVVPLRERDLG
jgi:rhamnopyranosyl-N-acetylglucosaminyl-diphospho-decaprenol beta-1,3/1,4-galactofuranosyltransferase